MGIALAVAGGILGGTHFNGIAQEGRDGGAGAGQDADDGAQDGGARDSDLHIPQFLEAHQLGADGLDGLALFLLLLGQLLEHFHSSEQADHDGDQLDAGGQQGAAEGEADVALDGVDADAGQPQADQAAGHGAHHVALVQGHQDGKAQEGHSEQLGRTELQRHAGQRPGEQQQGDAADDTADGGGDQHDAQCLAAFTAGGHGIAVKGGGGAGRRAGDREQDGADAAAGDGGAVHGHQQSDGGQGLQGVAEGHGDHHGHGRADAGHGAHDGANHGAHADVKQRYGFKHNAE